MPKVGRAIAVTEYNGVITITLSGVTPLGQLVSASLPLSTRLSASVLSLSTGAEFPAPKSGFHGVLDGTGMLAAVGTENMSAQMPVVLAPRFVFTDVGSPNLPIEDGLAGLAVTWAEANTFNDMRSALTVSAAGRFSGTIGSVEATGTIAASGVLVATSTGYSLVSIATNVAEGATGATAYRYTVARIGDATGTTSVAWAVGAEVLTRVTFGDPSRRSADGSDFVGGVYPSGALTFLPGETQKTLTVEVAGDTLIEPDETFSLTLEDGFSDVRAVTSYVTNRILNDDIAVFRIEAVDADRPEDDDGQGSFATFRISRTGVEDQQVSVAWHVNAAGGPGAVLEDFVTWPPGFFQGEVTFLPGETSHEVQVAVVGDAVAEGNEIYWVSLDNPRGGIVAAGNSSAFGLILNDDGGASGIADSTAADETFDMGEGDDLVRFSAPQSSYRIGIRDNRALVVGPDGTDMLVDVELVKFGTESAKPLSHLLQGAAEELLRYRAGADAMRFLLPQRYEGPLALDYIMGGDPQDNWLDGSGRNDFAAMGDGNDAAQMWGGDDIVDGGGGNNFLTGGAGSDQFFLDGRFAEPVWSCITDWEIGESLTIWGWRPGISVGAWGENAGLPGFLGATFFADIDGSGAVETVVTFTGRTVAEMPAAGILDVGGIGVLKFG